jgi:hypothetical protein
MAIDILIRKQSEDEHYALYEFKWDIDFKKPGFTYEGLMRLNKNNGDVELLEYTNDANKIRFCIDRIVGRLMSTYEKYRNNEYPENIDYRA